MRPDPARVRVRGGALVITSQNGDLQGNVEATQAGLVAFNRGGTTTDPDVAFDAFRMARVGEPVTATGGAGASVPATLSLMLGAPTTLGAFTPGVAKALEVLLDRADRERATREP